MGTITFTDILPDPFNKIGTAGQADSNGSAGPGFAGIEMVSESQIARDRTNSGRLISRNNSYHLWKFNIKYNDMTKEQLMPLYNFLLQKQGSMLPFYVSLPQYLNQNITNNTNGATSNAGSTTIEWQGTGAYPGAVFTLDAINHTKLYKVVRVETSLNYEGDSAPASERLHIMPPLQKEISVGTLLNFQTPMAYVINSSDTQQYSINNNNLYTFSAKFEEAL